MRLIFWILMLGMAGGARADLTPSASTAAPTTLSVGASAPLNPGAEVAPELRESDVYFAPEDLGEYTGQMGASSSVTLAAGTFYSRAHVRAYSGVDRKLLDGTELFLDGQFIGKSPVELTEFLVARDRYPLTARLDGWSEAQRPAISVPRDGELRIYLAPEDAGAWYTLPGALGGMTLLVLGLVTYSNTNGGPQVGLSLAGAGVGLIALTQGLARYVHAPALRRQVERMNAGSEAAP